MSSLRQSFLNGALTRLLDPDAVLKGKIVEFVSKGDFGLASGSKSDGSYERVWFEELLSPDEVSFEANVFLLTKPTAKALKNRTGMPPVVEPEPKPDEKEPITTEPVSEPKPGPTYQTVTLNLRGAIPPEMWNRLGTKLIPKLRSGTELKAEVNFLVLVDSKATANFESELRQILEDLGLADKIRIEKS
ncbi:MAG: hypothetical protein ACREQ7_17700 [Candidatus Binatia bacterium]